MWHPLLFSKYNSPSHTHTLQCYNMTTVGEGEGFDSAAVVFTWQQGVCQCMCWIPDSPCGSRPRVQHSYIPFWHFDRHQAISIQLCPTTSATLLHFSLLLDQRKSPSSTDCGNEKYKEWWFHAACGLIISWLDVKHQGIFTLAYIICTIPLIE